MKELVILSGKGGTGKTTLTSAFASLANNAVLADCDVDAADLHLILSPDVQQATQFYSGNEALIDPDLCTDCGKCLEVCRFDAIARDVQSGLPVVDPVSCEGCGVCRLVCRQRAIEFPETLCGQWFKSQTRFGPMVHARLGIGAENSGRLVSLVRKEARACAQQIQADLILVDGPPGIGCPVIASITGASDLFVITEPTLSGMHDMQRVLELAQHFRVPAYCCVNKWDLNEQITEQIESLAMQFGAVPLGRICYDPTATRAQMQAQTLIEAGNSPAAAEIKAIWQQLQKAISLPTDHASAAEVV
ncbi:ATP-binding protein [Reinekea marinisedimentorum]|uniref:MinD superfamily P-loop ATPase n=1 Tax=Reinekea marinisedimentorum TaxID=230495 RepID=A0A4R3I5H6_9GAMM|nr:ATP-binding protein [Reinekea marinisedimentorum]TCS40371.1 MinD superfamily P-loop ATPase [Reinekea marinisedimentorum]